MGIMKYVLMEADCDVCGTSYRFDFIGSTKKSEVIKELRENGWKIGKRCLCPKCKNVKVG